MMTRKFLLLICSLGTAIPASAQERPVLFRPAPSDSSQEPARPQVFIPRTKRVQPAQTTTIKSTATPRMKEPALVPPRAIPVVVNPDGSLTQLPDTRPLAATTPTQIPNSSVASVANVTPKTLLTPVSEATVNEPSKLTVAVQTPRKKTDEEKEREQEELESEATHAVLLATSVVGLGLAATYLYVNRAAYVERLSQAKRAMSDLALRRKRGEDINALVDEISHRLLESENAYRIALSEHQAAEAKTLKEIERLELQLDVVLDRPIDVKRVTISEAIDFLRRFSDQQGGKFNKLVASLQEFAGNYYIADPGQIENPFQNTSAAYAHVNEQLKILEEEVELARDELELKQDQLVNVFRTQQHEILREMDQLSLEIEGLNNGEHYHKDGRAMRTALTQKVFALANNPEGSNHTALEGEISRLKQALEDLKNVELEQRHQRMLILEETLLNLEVDQADTFAKLLSEFRARRLAVDILMRGSSDAAAAHERKKARAELAISLEHGATRIKDVKMKLAAAKDWLATQPAYKKKKTLEHKRKKTLADLEKLKALKEEVRKLEDEQLKALKEELRKLEDEQLVKINAHIANSGSSKTLGLVNERRLLSDAITDMRLHDETLESDLRHQIGELQKALDDLQIKKDPTQSGSPLKPKAAEKAALSRFRKALVSREFLETNKFHQTMRLELEELNQQLTLAALSDSYKANDTRLAELRAELIKHKGEIHKNKRIIKGLPFIRRFSFANAEYKFADRALDRAKIQYAITKDAIKDFMLSKWPQTTEALTERRDALSKRLASHDNLLHTVTEYLKTAQAHNTAPVDTTPASTLTAADCQTLINRGASQVPPPQ